MKVLMINVVCGIRSTGRICTDLAAELEKLGHEVKIAYGREKVPEQFHKYAIRIGTDLDVKLHGLKARLFDSAGFGSKRATEIFIEWVKQYDPDVIHLHNIHGYYLNVEVLFDYLRECGKKIIWTLHDCWSFTGHTAYCDAIDCKKWIDGCSECPLIKEYPKSFIDRSKKNWINKKKIFTDIPNLLIVTPSKWLATFVKQSFLKDYEVVVINNGIDTTKFHRVSSNFRKKYHLQDKKILLGVATSWDSMKGLQDYISLSKMLDDSFKIVLVGLTKEQIMLLPDTILALERTSSVEKLAEIYSAADLYVNLSYCDNYPTVNLEAIACGTPVLTYNTGGSAESAKHFGIVVSKGDINKIVEILNTGVNINKYIHFDFEYRDTVLRYLELYKEN